MMVAINANPFTIAKNNIAIVSDVTLAI
ncbi:hypothetical protein CNEO2_190018 [Clostridium neonatale]|nr:hypothetical protein CNEO2_190018 [Clostridium neonatale]